MIHHIFLDDTKHIKSAKLKSFNVLLKSRAPAYVQINSVLMFANFTKLFELQLYKFSRKKIIT